MDSQKLEKARKYLADFESSIGSTAAVRYLFDGLDLLDEIVAEQGKLNAIAKNIGDTYAQKVMDYAVQSLKTGNATEPELETLYKLLIELEAFEFGDKNWLTSLKLQTFKALFTSYFAGYSEEEKKKKLWKLLKGPDA